MKNHWNALKICLFGENTLSPGNLENTNNFEGWGLTIVTYKKIAKDFLGF